MELEVLKTRGIPQSGLLSISAGGMRKQVQLSAIDRPLRFASTDDISQIKVDVLDVRARARLPFQASETSEQTFTLSLDPKEAEPADPALDMEVDVVVRPCAPDSPSKATEELDAEIRQRKEADANGYLEEHGLVGFVQFLLHSLMQDKPSDPYPFLQKQLAMRITKQSGGSPTGSRAPPPLNMSETDDNEISSILNHLSPQAASSVSPEDIAKLELQALEASQRLRQDNAKLRETAELMKQEYEQLMEESRNLNQKLNAKKSSKQLVAETQAQAARKEVDKLQDEVSLLAQENAKLVSDLARGREMIDAVRLDMVQIQKTISDS